MRGKIAIETARAIINLICTGMRALLNPGSAIKQPPILQNAANSAKTVPSGSAITKLTQGY
jgi:hypothetical protein